MNSNLHNSKNTFQHVRITLTRWKLSINMPFNNMSLLTIPLNTTMSFYSVTIMTIFYIRKEFANKLLSYIKTFNKCHNVSWCTLTKQNNPWKNNEHFIFWNPYIIFLLFFCDTHQISQEKKDRQKPISCSIVQCPWPRDLTFHITGFLTTKSHILIMFLVINSH
jgi:hypothetical protein